MLDQAFEDVFERGPEAPSIPRYFVRCYRIEWDEYLYKEITRDEVMRIKRKPDRIVSHTAYNKDMLRRSDLGKDCPGLAALQESFAALPFDGLAESIENGSMTLLEVRNG